jgi:hypothetical protein
MSKPINLPHVSLEILQLITDIEADLSAANKRLRDALEREKKQTYWGIGKRIKEHLLLHSERADYGEYLFDILAGKLGISRTTLYLSVRFFEFYPSIVPTSEQLTWSHIVELVAIEDDSARAVYEEQIISNSLSVRDLRNVIQADQFSISTENSPNLTPLNNACDFIAIKTYYRDKFDRYLVDVFYKAGETSLLSVIDEGRFLNQALLDEGWAGRYVSG